MSETAQVGYREARADDLGFLQRMNYVAGYRPGPDAPSFEDGIRRPLVARYLRSWKGPHDAGIVAEQAGTPIGATWYTTFTAEDCLGALDNTSVPVIAIAIEEAWRGQGLGRALMQRLIETARRNGVDRLDLTVNPTNAVAVGMYRSLGFHELPTDERLARMTKALQ